MSTEERRPSSSSNRPLAALIGRERLIAKESRGSPSDIPTANGSLAWGVPPAAAVQQLVERGGYFGNSEEIDRL